MTLGERFALPTNQGTEEDQLEKQEKEEGPRSFARFIEQVGDGVAHAELSEELHKLTSFLQDEAVNRSSKARGTLLIKLGFEVMPNGVATIRYDIDAKRPKAQRNEAVAWVTPKGGNLVFENPKQVKLFPREVGGNEPVRETPAAKPVAVEV